MAATIHRLIMVTPWMLSLRVPESKVQQFKHALLSKLDSDRAALWPIGNEAAPERITDGPHEFSARYSRSA